MGFLRNKIVFSLVGLVILGIIVGIAHNHALDSGKSSRVQDVVRSILMPVNSSARIIFAFGDEATRIIRPRSAIIRENNNLRKEVRHLVQENATLREAASENVGLRQALGLRETMHIRMVAAEVVSRKESTWFDTATIDRGRNADVVQGSAVINHRGLIGQVIEVDPFSAQIVALTDPNSGVGAMVQRSRSSGILQGQGADYLTLTYLPKDADIKKKDIIISSGIGKVIPKGIVIGRVVRVIRNSVTGTTSALVRPSVDFDQVEQVFVVKPGQTLPE